MFSSSKKKEREMLIINDENSYLFVSSIWRLIRKRLLFTRETKAVPFSIFPETCLGVAFGRLYFQRKEVIEVFC